THGMGVSTPSAAAVALATSGFSRLLHIPKVGTLSIGIMSIIVAAGMPINDGLPGRSSVIRTDGASPKVQVSTQPAVRNSGMMSSFSARAASSEARRKHPEALSAGRGDHDFGERQSSLPEVPAILCVASIFR